MGDTLQNGDESSSETYEKIKVQTLQRMDSVTSGILSPSGSSPNASQHHARRKHRTEPFLIGVAGGTASGKTTVCDQIVQRLHGA